MSVDKSLESIRFERNKNAAAAIMAYYFRTIYKKVGLNWSTDNENEVRGVFEAIYELIKEEK